jgi:hypothetical protein
MKISAFKKLISEENGMLPDDEIVICIYDSNGVIHTVDFTTEVGYSVRSGKPIGCIFLIGNEDEMIAPSLNDDWQYDEKEEN